MSQTMINRSLVEAGLLTAALTVGDMAAAVPLSIADVSFDSDDATTTAAITGGGYLTPYGIALHSGTSPDWSVSPSQGTYYQVPTFQHNYRPDQPTNGEPGSAVTLGQDARFPQTSLNERDIIQLGWGTGNGLANQAGVPDLVVFEAATSEAFALRVHSTGNGSGAYWSAWYYSPYASSSDPSALANDTTPTLFDLDAMGLLDGEVINAIEITNLLLEDTVDRMVSAIDDHAEVFFGGSSIPGQDFAPLRYSSSQAAFVEFEAGKYDPDIQYVAGLHPLSTGVSGLLSPVTTGLGLSAPARLPPTGTPAVPLPAVPALMGVALPLLLGWRRRRFAMAMVRPARAGSPG